jgi:pimeloyl-[acyl-carrier protein] methyl ester esterase
MGEAVYVEKAGTGPAMVLLHGWGMNSGVWESVAAGFTDRYRVHRVDLPGFGYSEEVEPPTLEAWAAAVRRAVPVGAVWVGWSLGGLLALEAARAGAQPRGLVLVGSTPRFVQGDGWHHAVAPEVLDQFASALDVDYRAALVRFLALQAKGSERARDEVRVLKEQVFTRGEPRRSALAAGLRMLRETDLRDSLGALAMPTLLLHGERDTLAPLAAARWTAQALPSGRLETVPGAGHAPFISHSELFMQRLGAFIDGLF